MSAPRIVVRHPLFRIVGIAAALALAALAATEERPWRDPSGEPLPFATDAELLEFLRTASVLEEEEIGAGVNRTKKVLLERDGVRAHAVFREVAIEAENSRVGERIFRRFRDSFLFECAAFELSRLIGLDAVPPAVVRRIGNRTGSLQIWIEDVLDETGDSFRPTPALAWVQQLWDLYFFDNLIFNVDRNNGNLLVDTSYRLWMIDHTRAFQTVSELLDDRVDRARRATFERVKALTEEEVREALGDYLDPAERRALLSRRDLLVEHLERLAAERGEDIVFFE